MSDPATKPPAKMSSRDRDELLKKGIHVTPQPAAPVPRPQPQEQELEPEQAPDVQSQQPEQDLLSTQSPPEESLISEHDRDNNDNEVQSSPRGFVCEKCKWCDGFEPLEGDQQMCSVCKCDLIFHIDVIEEDDDDAEEFSSGEEDLREAGVMQAESSSDQD